jgi:hypothetical protein
MYSQWCGKNIFCLNNLNSKHFTSHSLSETNNSLFSAANYSRHDVTHMSMNFIAVAMSLTLYQLRKLDVNRICCVIWAEKDKGETAVANFKVLLQRSLGRMRDATEHYSQDRRVYPKVSGLVAWSENCKWYSSLPLGAVVSLFCDSV